VAGIVPGPPGIDASWAAREDAQAKAYDEIGPRYDEAFPHKDGQIECARRLLAELPEGAEVLDVGCGTGLPTARQLVAGGCRVTGIDIAPVMLATARANVPEATFIRRDVLSLDESSEGRYAAVVAFFSLLNLPKARIKDSLGLLYRSLLPGGRLAYGMVEADVDDTQIAFLGSRIRVTGYPRYELRAVLADAGFEQEWEHVLSYAPATAQAAPEIQIFGLCRRGG
jgi:SAM-dependent methyltransferase